MKNYLCVGLIYSLIFLTANASISNNLKCYSGVGHISESHIYCPNNQKFSCSSIKLDQKNFNKIIRGCLLTSLCQNSTDCCDTDLCNIHDPNLTQIDSAKNFEVITTQQSNIIQAKDLLRCYACQDCQDDTKSWLLQECPANYTCSTVKSLVNGRVSTTKGCVPKCSNSTSNYSKSSVTSSCCNQNFCNADLVNRQSVVMPSPYKLNEHPLKCYVCKNCGSDKASVIEECPAVSDYFCSTIQTSKNGEIIISKGCSKFCVSLTSRLKTSLNGKLETCCNKSLCNSESRVGYSSVSLGFVLFFYVILT